ncbi:MAG: sulfite exporter TauE/SafE family protein [Johnsonella sp.]|nr:sulfite exporter TauE/SafE family protein [Johnsonella sp.]
MSIIIFLICLLASFVGAICGIGGGIIIKPLLDALSVMDVAAISFLSGFTVFIMSFYSIVQCRLSKSSSVEGRIGTPLAIGAVLGGIGGKALFSKLSALGGDLRTVGAIQALCLLLLTLGTLLYTLFKDKIATRRVDHIAPAFLIGGVLGMLSSFLGIGGGPMNLVVLYYFFSMRTKEAAENSLYIIMFSQAASLILAVITGRIPEFDRMYFLLMAFGGLAGGILGRHVNKTIKEETVHRLFIFLMILMILINLYNLYHFMR